MRKPALKHFLLKSWIFFFFLLPFLTVVLEHAFALIVGNIDVLQRVEHGCHILLRGVIRIGTLVELEQMSELVDGSILVTDGLVKTFDVTFLMVRQLVGVGMLLCESESPGLVTEWIVTGERGLRWEPRLWLRHSGRRVELVGACRTWLIRPNGRRQRPCSGYWS